jgi:hypothetical protein
MNTIQITNADGQTVNYTETEITTIIKNGADNAKYVSTLSDQLREIRNEVRDFFSEGEWDSGEQTVNKRDVNELLGSIGANKLTTKYRGAASIHFVFEVEAEDEDEAKAIIEENATVQEYGFDASDESVEVTDMDEHY